MSELWLAIKFVVFVLYSPLSQSQNEFDIFSDNFEMTLEMLAQKSSFLVTVIGNSKISHDKTSFEDWSIEKTL